MDRHNLQLAAFLAGNLDPAAVRRLDEHLLACEQCWQAVREDRAGRQAAQVLRRQAPPGLADRVAFAVEVAAASPVARQRRLRPGIRSRPGRRPRWQWLAGTAALAVGVAAALLAVLAPAGNEGGNIPPAVAAVARYARAVPPPQHNAHTGGLATPVEVGHPVTLTAGGQQIVVRTWRLGGTEAVVAVSGQAFPMPPGSVAGSGAGMAWSVRLGKLELYCVNGPTSELVAAPVPAAELASLAARLPMA
jgi:anti-sigma factor RsiW